MNLRPSGYEPDELPGCSTPRGCLGLWVRFVCSGWGCWSGLVGPGGDLLSRVLRRSTIGAEGFHGRVREGIGCLAPRHDHQVGEDQMSDVGCRASDARGALSSDLWALGSGRSALVPLVPAVRPARRCGRVWDQADRAISTGQLHALLRFHLRPIDVVVYHGSDGENSFRGGFPA